MDLSGVASRDILRKEWRKEDLKARHDAYVFHHLASIREGRAFGVVDVVIRWRFSKDRPMNVELQEGGKAGKGGGRGGGGDDDDDDDDDEEEEEEA